LRRVRFLNCVVLHRDSGSDKSAVVAGLTLSVSQWARRGPGPEAQISQAFHVWPRQTSSVTATFTPRGLICTETFVSQLSSSVSYFSSHLTPRQFKQVCRLPPLFVVRSKQAHLFWGRAITSASDDNEKVRPSWRVLSPRWPMMTLTSNPMRSVMKKDAEVMLYMKERSY
jgi:hypothetical protein